MLSRNMVLDGVEITVFENGTVVINNAIKRPGCNGCGYLYLRVKPCGKLYKVHRLVAMAFIPNPENKPQVNHIDGNKSNNHYKNLEWCSVKENIVHAWKTGLNKARYGKDSKHKTPVNQYDIDGKFIASYNTTKEAAQAVGVHPNAITNAINGWSVSAGGFIWQRKQNIQDSKQFKTKLQSARV